MYAIGKKYNDIPFYIIVLWCVTLTINILRITVVISAYIKEHLLFTRDLVSTDYIINELA